MAKQDTKDRKIKKKNDKNALLFIGFSLRKYCGPIGNRTHTLC